jgi:hypothetical protein
VIEHEIKLVVPHGFALPGLDGVGATHATDPHTARLCTTYWDTEDLRIARWDACLRHRGGEGWTVKLRAADDPARAGDPAATGDAAAMMRRIELTFPGGSGAPAPDAADIVCAYSRTAPLAPRATMFTVRTTVSIRNAENVEVAEVAHDVVSADDGPQEGCAFQEVEVELRDAATPSLLGAILTRLRDAGAGVTSTTSKQARLLGETGPPEIPPPPSTSDADHTIGARLAMATVALVRSDPPFRVEPGAATARHFASHAATLQRRLVQATRASDGGPHTGLAGRLEPIATAGDPATLLARIRERSYLELLEELVALAARASAA